MNNHTRIKTRTIVVTAILLTVLPLQSDADYRRPHLILRESTHTCLFHNVSRQGEPGVESVLLDVLTALGQAVVALVSVTYPQAGATLGDILSTVTDVVRSLLNNGEGANEQTQRMINEIRDAHCNLLRGLEANLDEIMDQYKVDLASSMEAQADNIYQWLATDDQLMQRKDISDMDVAWRELDLVRITIQNYIESDADPRIMYRRLQLLPSHIIAALLSVQAHLYETELRAFHAAFLRSPYGSEESRFNEWYDGLAETDKAEIRATNTRFPAFKNRVYTDIMNFYHSIADQDLVDAYVQSIFTPIVSQMEVFQADPSIYYNNPAVVTSDGSWGLVPHPPPPWYTFPGPGDRPAGVGLDGVRWYYYVDIPRPQCLTYYASQDLSDTHSPWREVADDPSASNCNRFWIVALNIVSDALPNTYLGSFDGYSVWFNDAGELYNVHKKLIHGDLLRAIYGPISLMLDAMHTEHFGRTRTPNRWDRVFDEYDKQVAMLGISNAWGEAKSYEDAVWASTVLEQMGVTIETVGLERWFEELKALVDAHKIYVDNGAACPGRGSQRQPYCLLTTAITAAAPGDVIIIKSGDYPERLTTNKRLIVISSEGPVVIGQ